MKLSAQDKAMIFNSIAEVGTSKAVGYLPLRTIEKFLGVQIDDLQVQIKKKGLKSAIFDEKFTYINSGAYYVYDEIMLRELIAKHEVSLRNAGFNMHPADVVKKIAKSWYPPEHEIVQFIKEAFGD